MFYCPPVRPHQVPEYNGLEVPKHHFAQHVPKDIDFSIRDRPGVTGATRLRGTIK